MMFKVLLNKSKEVVCHSLVWSTLEPDLVNHYIEPNTGIVYIDPTVETNVLHDVVTQQPTQSKTHI